MKLGAITKLFGLAALVSSCGFFPEKVSLDDPRLKPMLRAIAAVDRESKGFTSITHTADIRLESRSRDRYDAMLHIYGVSSRTIAFRKTSDGYKWIGEQEIFRGPRTYDSVDGTFHEEICINYDIEKVSGFPLNKLSITYTAPGKDSHPEYRDDLTLKEARNILRKWGKI